MKTEVWWIFPSFVSTTCFILISFFPFRNWENFVVLFMKYLSLINVNFFIVIKTISSINASSFFTKRLRYFNVYSSSKKERNAESCRVNTFLFCLTFPTHYVFVCNIILICLHSSFTFVYFFNFCEFLLRILQFTKTFIFCRLQERNGTVKCWTKLSKLFRCLATNRAGHRVGDLASCNEDLVLKPSSLSKPCIKGSGQFTLLVVHTDTLLWIFTPSWDKVLIAN